MTSNGEERMKHGTEITRNTADRLSVKSAGRDALATRLHFATHLQERLDYALRHGAMVGYLSGQEYDVLALALDQLVQADAREVEFLNRMEPPAKASEGR